MIQFLCWVVIKFVGRPSAQYSCVISLNWVVECLWDLYIINVVVTDPNGLKVTARSGVWKKLFFNPDMRFFWFLAEFWFLGVIHEMSVNLMRKVGGVLVGLGLWLGRWYFCSVLTVYALRLAAVFIGSQPTECVDVADWSVGIFLTNHGSRCRFCQLRGMHKNGRSGPRTPCPCFKDGPLALLWVSDFFFFLPVSCLFNRFLLVWRIF